MYTPTGRDGQTMRFARVGAADGVKLPTVRFRLRRDAARNRTITLIAHA